MGFRVKYNTAAGRVGTNFFGSWPTAIHSNLITPNGRIFVCGKNAVANRVFCLLRRESPVAAPSRKGKPGVPLAGESSRSAFAIRPISGIR
jgi:hypothetical protein